jgi:hypothetical protein
LGNGLKDWLQIRHLQILGGEVSHRKLFKWKRDVEARGERGRKEERRGERGEGRGERGEGRGERGEGRREEVSSKKITQYELLVVRRDRMDYIWVHERGIGALEQTLYLPRPIFRIRVCRIFDSH